MCVLGRNLQRFGGKRPRNLKRVGMISSIYCGEMMVEVPRETVRCEAVGQICGKCWSRIYSSIGVPVG